MILQNLLAGIDPQVAIGEPLVPQRRLGKLSVVSILEDDDQESLGVEGNGRAPREGSWSDMPMGQATWFAVMAL